MPARRAATEAGGAIQVGLVVGRSMVIDIGAPIQRVSLTSADVADALVTSSSQLLLNGKVPGSISMFVWERSGALRLYEIVVNRDLDHLSQQLKQLFPGEAIDVHANGKDVVLSGRVSTKAVAEQVVNVAAGYAGKENIVSLLAAQQAPRTDQVLLRVRFAEVSRSALTELGVSFFTSPLGVKNTIGQVTTQQFGARAGLRQDRAGAPPPRLRGAGCPNRPGRWYRRGVQSWRYPESTRGDVKLGLSISAGALPSEEEVAGTRR
jgi:Flp pilus assembly secretin CpaC